MRTAADVRQKLADLIDEHDTDLATVSKAIGKNHAYLQQFIKRGVPSNLPEDVREGLGAYFKVDPELFRSGSAPRHGIRLEVTIA